MTTEELIAYYVALLIIQYNTKLRAQATIAAIISVLVGDQIIQQVEDGFDIPTAIGAQLDVLGQYKGVTRNIFGLDLGINYFSLHLYDDANPDTFIGFASYSDTAAPSSFIRLYDGDPNSLTDSQFRALIGYMADVESLSLTLGEIDLLLYKWFGNYVTLTDNGNMTITYTEDPSDPGTLFKTVAFINALPDPAGVLVNVS